MIRFPSSYRQRHASGWRRRLDLASGSISKGAVAILAIAGLLLESPAARASTPVTFQVDMTVQIALGSFDPAGGELLTVAGDLLNGWSTTASVLTNAPTSSLYSGTFNFTNPVGSTASYKFVMNGLWEKNNVGPGETQNRQFTLATEPQVLPVVYFDNLTNASLLQSTQAPYRASVVGADMSMLAYYESQGTKYRDAGQVDDALRILKRRGFNCIRLRLFTSSAAQALANPYNYQNNLEYTVPLAVRVKNAGLQFALDFHYSDSWADPGHQWPPGAWTNLTFPQLVGRMREYNSNCIATFRAAGAMPDFVQVGNEITPGFLWPIGRVGGSYDTAEQWSQFVQLLNAARQGIQDAAGPELPKFIVHIDRGGDWVRTQWFFDNLLLREFQFDIIGLSYYPTWHGALTGLSNCLTRAARRYHKAIFVAETGFPWASNTPTNIFGFPATLEGQVQYVIAFAQIAKSVPGAMVPGAFWWGTEYPGSWNSLFDSGINVVPAAESFGQLGAAIRLNLDRAGTNLTLRWPLSGAGMALESSGVPKPPWSAVTNTIQATGTGLTLPVIPNSNTFYRLRGN